MLSSWLKLVIGGASRGGLAQILPPLQGVLCWLCWARYPSTTSHSPLSLLMGKDTLKTWLQGLMMRRIPRTRFLFCSGVSLVLRSSTSLSSTMEAPRSKKPSTILKKLGSSGWSAESAYRRTRIKEEDAGRADSTHPEARALPAERLSSSPKYRYMTATS